MRKFTIKEFANATGQLEGTVRKHIERKRLKKLSDGFINPDTDFNKAYINTVTNGAGLNGAIVKKEPVRQAKTDRNENPTPLNASQFEYQDLEIRKKRADVERLERQNELQMMELEKKAGNLLPVDVMQSWFVINCQSIVKNFKMELENLNSVYVERFGGDRSVLAEITKKQLEILDVAYQRAKTDAAHDIEIAINEYQDVRGRGEKK